MIGSANNNCDSFTFLPQVIEFDDGSGSVLRIQPLRTPRDEAIYECVASNSVGEVSVTTRLIVLRGKKRQKVCGFCFSNEQYDVQEIHCTDV